MKKKTALLSLLLAAALLLTACGSAGEGGQHDVDASGVSVRDFDDLGTYELTEPAYYEDGILRFAYDGNYFLPVQLVNPDDYFSELTITQADLRETENNTAYGYFYYAVGQFEEDFQDIITAEESYTISGTPEDLVKTEYKPGTKNFLGFKYTYTYEDKPMYAIITVQNLPSVNGCYIATMNSDRPEAIDKAIEMFDTAEIYGEAQDEEQITNSFLRTDAIYAHLCPEEYAAASESALEDANQLIEDMAQESTFFFTEGVHEMTVGEKYTPTLAGADAENVFSFVATNDDVATVTSKGEVIAVSEGVSIIVASTEDGKMTELYIKVHPVEQTEE